MTRLGETATFMVPSHDPTAPEYDGLRYWRGPVWLIVNYMISDGLKAAGQDCVAQRIDSDSIRLIEKSGFAEYYDPVTGRTLRRQQFHLDRRNGDRDSQR